jgi:hypothetical protein
MNWIFIVATLVAVSWADREAKVTPQQEITPQEYIDNNWPHGPSYRPPVDVVRGELNCIRSKASPKDDIATPDAAKMIEILAQPLENAFRKFKVSRLERALFYSQALEESGGFTTLNERPVYKNKANADDPIGHLALAALDDVHKVKDKNEDRAARAKRALQYKEFRGKGLMQLSRCDNYLSVIHYLNQMNAGKTPVWKPYWEYPVSDKILVFKKVVDGKTITERKRDLKQISQVCTPEQRKLVAAEYERETGMNANLYGAWDEPQKFAMLGADFTDPLSKKTISSEKFMVESSLAIWRGSCGKAVNVAANSARLKQDPLCADFKDEDYAVHATRCVTNCIRGNIKDAKDLEKRQRWLGIAMSCLAK